MEIIYIPQTSTRIYELITVNGIERRPENCFPCTCCNSCLGNKAYFVWNHNKYCSQCFEKLYGQKCAFCQKPIAGSKQINFIYYDKQTWHAECFKCPNCHESLKETCFSPTHTVTCSKCGSSLKSPNVR